MLPFSYPLVRISPQNEPHVTLRLVGEHGVYGDGETKEEAIENLKEAFLSLCDACQFRREPIPLPGNDDSAESELVLDLITSLRIVAHNEMVSQGIKPSHVAKRLGVAQSTLSRNLNFFRNGTRIEALFEVIDALGRVVRVEID